MVEAYNVNKDIVPANFAGALQSGLQAGQNFSEGLLKNYGQRQQMAMTGQLNDLKQQYLQAPDAQTQQGLLNKMMVLDPTSAKTMAEGQQIVGGGMLGTDFNSQLFNQRLKLYQANGVPLQDAQQKASNDVLQTIVSPPNMMGQTTTRPTLPMINGSGQGNLGGQSAPQAAPAQGGLGSPQMSPIPQGNQTAPTNMSRPAPSIMDNIAQAAPEEQKFVNDFAALPADQRAAFYTANAATHPDLPKVLTPDVEDQLMNIHGAMQDTGVTPSASSTPPSNIPVGGNPANAAQQNNVFNTPLGQSKLTEARATKSVDDEATIQKDATDAAKNLDNYKQVYSIFNSGFKGGAASPYSFDALKAKQASGIALTPEEQQYSNDYTTLKKMSDISTGMNIKDMFQRVSNFELGFAKNLQAQPSDMPTSAIITASIREAADRQKILKNDMKDQWINQYGSLAAKTPSGQSFSSALNEQLDNHPMLTPSFMAERGVTVPIRQFGSMTPAQVAASLPSGAKYINPADGKTYIKK